MLERHPGAFSVGRYILLYLDGELRSDEEPQGADVNSRY